MHISEVIAEYICQTDFENFPRSTIKIAKHLCLDTIGAGLAGTSADGMPELISQVKEWGGKQEATIFNRQLRVPAHNAAFVNATLAHARELDDFHDTAFVHSSVVVLPAALAVAEAVEASGLDFLTAFIIGSDLACRLGMACQSYKGWHLTAVCGVFGAAAAAAKLLSLNSEEIINALGIAYAQCSGNRQGVADGALTKRMQAGFPAQSGVFASFLAKQGMTGANRAIDGPFGLVKLYFDNQWDWEKLLSGLGEQFEVENISIKRFPCCRWTHPSIEAIASIKEEFNINVDEVEEVLIETPNLPMFDIVSQPLTAEMVKQVDVQFNLPYLIATTLFEGSVGIGDLESSAILDPSRRDLAKRIKVTPITNALSPKAFIPTEVTIFLKNKRVYQKSITRIKGTPEERLSEKELKRKMRSSVKYASPIIDEIEIDRLFHTIHNIHKIDNMKYHPNCVRRS